MDVYETGVIFFYLSPAVFSYLPGNYSSSSSTSRSEIGKMIISTAILRPICKTYHNRTVVAAVNCLSRRSLSSSASDDHFDHVVKTHFPGELR